MKFDSSKIKKILVISLSNVGDVILTFPVIDILKRDFPSSDLSVVVGPKAEALFKDNPYISRVYVFNKRQPISHMIRWVFNLRKEGFDLVVDLRNTAIPFILGAKYKTSPFVSSSKILHRKEKHLRRLKSVVDFVLPSKERFALHVTDKDRSYVQNLFKSHMPSNEKFVVVGPGAANHIKRWREEGFSQICDKIIEDYKMQIVFVGDDADKEVVFRIKDQMKNKGIDFSGQTSLGQLAEILRRSVFVIANDSAIMHMASYLDVPVLAIFGPTDSNKYGPWSSKSYVVKKTGLFCAPCEKSGCAYHHECMEYIEPQEILEKIKTMIKELC